MKQTTYIFLLMIIALSLTVGSQAQTNPDRDLYDWQETRYPKIEESFKEDVDKISRPRPELSTPEEVHQWQLDDYDNTEESFKEDIKKQSRPRPEFTSEEEMYKWQLEEYENTEEIEPTLPEHY